MISPTRSLNSSYCALALGLADLPGHHLAGHLGLDPAELEGREDLLVGLADEGLGIVPQGLRQPADADGLDRKACPRR
jgi:hypothetical protein